MKKTLISKIVAGILLVGINSNMAMAADTTTITKATVKLIKNQREIKEDLSDIKLALKKADIKINKIDSIAKTSNNEADKALKTTSTYKEKIAQNEKDVKSLKKKLKNLEMKLAKVEKDNMITQEKIKILERIMNEKFASMKRIMNSELKIIKAKLEGTKPVYIVEEKIVTKDSSTCKTGMCPKKVNKKIDSDIDAFIK